MDYVAQFLASIVATKNLSDHTIKAYKSDLCSYLAYEKDVMQPDICTYISYLHDTLHRKDSTIRRKIITLKLFYDYLSECGLLPCSPVEKLKFRYRKERCLPRTLSVPEVVRLLRCFELDPETLSPFAKMLYIRDAALIDLLISTGIRIGEAAFIALEDVIVSEHTLLIHGKGRKQRLIYISSPMTWTRILALLKERRMQHGQRLFVNRYGAPLSIHGIEDVYRKYTCKAGLTTRSTPHFLRHTFATNLRANGADLRSVQEILGHASVATTQIYTEVTTHRKRQVLKKFNFRNKL